MSQIENTRTRSGRRATFSLDPGFSEHLNGYRLTRLGDSPNVIYVLDDEFRIRGFNETYRKSALRLGGRRWLRRYGMGFPVLKGFMGFYADHYRRIYARCLLTRRPFGSIYGGASPRSYRWYRETVQPLHDGSGLLVTHHLLQALPRTEAGRYDAGVHRNPDGLVLQCCHCGRVRNERKPGLWEWLPELEDDCPEDAISHGICPRCLDTYYQDLLPV